MTTRIGSLFSGYGGLELGIQSVLGAETVWHSEFDAAPSRILAHHWPTVPNHGDITRIDWNAVEPVDILCGGFPCQDVSTAGLRTGLKPGTRSGLWINFAEAIDALRPELVVIENVRGLLSAGAHSAVEPDPWDLGDRHGRPPLRALGAVLGDLADLGYDAQWRGLRAADAGAPHGRYRIFITARPADTDGERHGRWEDPRMVGRLDDSDASEARQRERARRLTRDRSATAAADPGREHGDPRRRIPSRAPQSRRPLRDHAGRRPGTQDWGPYDAAIRRWEHVLGREAPNPNDGKSLSPRFVEWMMGLEPGHVTGVGLTRNEQLKALGNGVVPQQAALALTRLLTPAPVAA